LTCGGIIPNSTHEADWWELKGHGLLAKADQVNSLALNLVVRKKKRQGPKAGRAGAELSAVTLPGESWRVLLQTFRTKIFLALADDFSAKIASQLCGREDRFKVAYNLAETGHDTRINLVTGKALSNRANITTSKSYIQQSDYRFDMKIFAELRNAQSVTIAYDGTNPIAPTFCYLKPYYNDPNKSYFEQASDGEL
jgi:hypothetical protein